MLKSKCQPRIFCSTKICFKSDELKIVRPKVRIFVTHMKRNIKDFSSSLKKIVLGREECKKERNA